MSSEYSVLTLSFLEDGIERGSLQISVRGCPDLEHRPIGHVPEYVVPGLSEGVMYVDNQSDVDGDIPLQVYTGDDGILSPVLLLENVTYEVSLKAECESSFDYLRAHSGEISLMKLRFNGMRGEEIYVLQFRSYVGKGYLDITVGGRRLEIPFEVRSRKIGYLTDYPQMLSDIAEFSASLLMNVRSPLHTCYDISDHGSGTAYEDFLILDYLFTKLDLIGAYSYVRENRQTELVSDTESVPAGLAADVDPSDLESLISGDNLVSMESGPIAGLFAPLEVSERFWTDCLDTPENRLVKDLVLTVDRMVRSLLVSGQSAGSDYVKTRLSEMSEFLDGVVRDQWLKDVGELTSVPYDSTILQNRHGYSDLFHMYQILGLGAAFRQDDAEDILSGQNKKLHTVYEYWCYTRLFLCLSKMSDEVPEPPMGNPGGRWTISIRGKKSRFSIPVGNSRLTVDLFYNRDFSSRSPDFRSYSVRLRPDFTLLVSSSSSPGRMFLVNFDAKYRVKPLTEDIDVESDDVSSDSWEYDICKMHTYRDALIHSCGSYVLFPGSKLSIYNKPWDQREWDSKNDSLIPSVGAIPLIPGDSKMLSLSETLTEVLMKIVDISENDGCIGDISNYLF